MRVPGALSAYPWSPYTVGALIGILSWLAFASADQPLGITTAFENTASLAAGASGFPAGVGVEHAAARALEGKPPRIDWEWALVVGVLVGSWIAARLGRARDPERVPDLWARRFGPRPGTRYAGAFVGGALLMLGARIAGGCTSGHGVSGALQLALSSWMFVAILFLAGVAVAHLVFGREGAGHAS